VEVYLVYRADDDFRPMNADGYLIAFGSVKVARQHSRKGDTIGSVTPSLLQLWAKRWGLIFLGPITGRNINQHPLIKSWISSEGQ